MALQEIDRLLSLRSVLEIVEMSRSTLLRRVASGEFPQPVRHGPRCVRWKGSDVQRWIEALAPDGDEKNDPPLARRVGDEIPELPNNEGSHDHDTQRRRPAQRG